MEADYYLIAGQGEQNTFSLETVKRLQAEFGEKVLTGVVKRKLVDVNRVLAENFPRRAPDFVSTDTEGYDFTILSSIDFERFRPCVFCVETLSLIHILPSLDPPSACARRLPPPPHDAPEATTPAGAQSIASATSPDLARSCLLYTSREQNQRPSPHGQLLLNA